MTSEEQSILPATAFEVGAKACRSILTGKPRFFEFDPNELDLAARMLDLFARIATEARDDAAVAAMAVKLLALSGEELQ